MEQYVKWQPVAVGGGAQVLGESLLQCHFLNHNCHMNWHGLPEWETENVRKSNLKKPVALAMILTENINIKKQWIIVLKSFIFWGKMDALKVNRHFGEKFLFHFKVEELAKKETSTKRVSSRSPKLRLTFGDLYGVTS
jgi:hypothetical protein